MLQFNPYTYHIDGEATRLYQRTRRRSQWHKLWAGLTRQPSRLHNLAEYKAKYTLTGSSYAGIRSVPLYQIRGSEGRANDFDLDFCPLHSHNRERWLNLARAWQQGVPIPRLT